MLSHIDFSHTGSGCLTTSLAYLWNKSISQCCLLEEMRKDQYMLRTMSLVTSHTLHPNILSCLASASFPLKPILSKKQTILFRKTILSLCLCSECSCTLEYLDTCVCMCMFVYTCLNVRNFKVKKTYYIIKQISNNSRVLTQFLI